ncbi:MAG: three-Cys-motif partner protein TcmP [Candidatus Thorarchaeota archaeon]
MMPLQFHGDAIVLSGLYGTKLKTEIIAEYYEFWLSIVTSRKYNEVNIVEMDAGTGEVYIADINKTILGSAGHALDLRYGKFRRQLNVVLIEKSKECREHMDNIILRRWPSARFTTTTNGKEISFDGKVTRYVCPDDFLTATGEGAISGLSLFFFDPLLSVDWEVIDKIASKRITKPYKIGTEFLIFFFTSDWLTGRITDEGEFKPLPKTPDERTWTEDERSSARIADATFGGRDWLEIMISGGNKEALEYGLVQLYKKKLSKWFRFIVPLPFVPKPGQTYHVFCCSNYDVGTDVISRIYESRTRQAGLQADNKQTYTQFKKNHPALVRGYRGQRRPSEWKVLWHILKHHEDGRCDCMCGKLTEKISEDNKDLPTILQWLEKEGYLEQIDPLEWPWSESPFPIYRANWEGIKNRLGVDKPFPLEPLKPP